MLKHAFRLGMSAACRESGVKFASELTDPFKLVPDRQLSDEEQVAMIRQAIIAEHDATAQYTLQAQAARDPVVKKTLLDIADEERVHIGELTKLLQRLTKNEDKLMRQGAEEVEE